MAQASIIRGLWATVILMLGGSALFAATAWRENLTREQVIAALGRPQSDLRGGNRESMTYPGDVTIELQNGVVTNIVGTVPDALKPVAGAAASATTLAATPVSAPVTAPVPETSAPATPLAATAAPAMAASPAEIPGKTTAAPAKTGDKEDFDTTIEDYAKSGIVPAGALPEGLPKGLSLPGMTPAQPADPNDWSKPNNLTGFIAGLLIKTLVMSAVLKGVFMHKDFPILWREVLLVGGGVALCNQVLAYLFTLNDFGEIAAMVQADQLAAAVVLLTLIMNFTAAKQFPTAAGITLTAMIVNIGVGYAMLFFL